MPPILKHNPYVGSASDRTIHKTNANCPLALEIDPDERWYIKEIPADGNYQLCPYCFPEVREGDEVQEDASPSSPAAIPHESGAETQQDSGSNAFLFSRLLHRMKGRKQKEQRAVLPDEAGNEAMKQLLSGAPVSAPDEDVASTEGGPARDADESRAKAVPASPKKTAVAAAKTAAGKSSKAKSSAGKSGTKSAAKKSAAKAGAAKTPAAKKSSGKTAAKKGPAGKQPKK